MKKITDLLFDRDSGGAIFAGYAKLIAAWKTAIPDNMVKHTSPITISSSGVLTVLVDDNIFLQELNYLKEEFIELLAKTGLEVKSINYKYMPLRIKDKEIAGYRYELTPDAEKIVARASRRFLDNADFKDEFEAAMKAYFTRYTVDHYKGR